MDGHFVPNQVFAACSAGARLVGRMFFRCPPDCWREPEKIHRGPLKPSGRGPDYSSRGGGGRPGENADPGRADSQPLEFGRDIPKPGTPAEAVRGVLSDFELILVMSVEPGFGGQAYIDDVNDKITRFGRWRTGKTLPRRLKVDGGINEQNIQVPVCAGGQCSRWRAPQCSAPRIPAGRLQHCVKNAARAVKQR